MRSHFLALHRLLAALLLAAVLPLAHAASNPGQGTWQTTLQPRDLDGNLGNGPEAFYDTAQRITWLGDAFQALTSGYQPSPLYSPGDSLIWPHAVTWAENLVLYGITDWRLPKSFDTGAPGCTIDLVAGECGYNVDPFSSELAYTFHVHLGNLSYLSPGGVVVSGSGLSNSGPFFNVYNGYYWSETSYDAVHAWNFDYSFGRQGPAIKSAQGSAVWAVLDGDRGTPMALVPEPGTWALWLTGLALLMTAVRKRRL